MSSSSAVPLAVDQEYAARLYVVDHLVALDDIGRVVAGHKVGLVDVIRALDRLVAKAQVRDGDTAGLFGVILEVCLNIFVGMVADDLNGVFVRANGTVAAQTPEFALDGAFGSGVRRGLLFGRERCVTSSLMPMREVSLGLVLGQLVIHGKDAGRRGVLGAEAVTAADDRCAADAGCSQSGNNIHIQRFADGARLLGAVENSNLLCGCRNGGSELFAAERTIQANFDKTDLFTLCGQVIDDFFRNVADGAHGNNYAFGIRCAVVVEQLDNRYPALR